MRSAIILPKISLIIAFSCAVMSSFLGKSVGAAGCYNLGGFWRAPVAVSSSPPNARLISIAYNGSLGTSTGMTHTGFQISTTGVTNGDLLLFFACIDNGSTSMWPNPIAPGFTQIAQDYFGNDGETCVADWKTAYNEPATYSGTYGPGLNSGDATLALIAVSGYDALAPIQSTRVSYQTGTGAQPVVGTSAGLTSTMANTLIVYASGVDWECGGGTTVFTAPSGYTSLAQLGDGGGTSWEWTSMQVATAVKAGPGSTGTISGNQTVSRA